MGRCQRQFLSVGVVSERAAVVLPVPQVFRHLLKFLLSPGIVLERISRNAKGGPESSTAEEHASSFHSPADLLDTTSMPRGEHYCLVLSTKEGEISRRTEAAARRFRSCSEGSISSSWPLAGEHECLLMVGQTELPISSAHTLHSDNDIRLAARKTDRSCGNIPVRSLRFLWGTLQEDIFTTQYASHRVIPSEVVEDLVSRIFSL